MAEHKMVSIRRLLLDEWNPRLRRRLAQDEAIAHFASQKTTRQLAKHIAANGINPLESIAIFPTVPPSRKYVVREGNRRLAAIKLLHEPSLAASATDQQFYQKLISKPHALIPDEISCVLFEDESEVRRWIGLKHVSDASGASTLIWEPWQKANFDGNSGTGAKYRHAIELSNVAIDKGWINDADHEKINLSTLSRLFEDDSARSELGFQVTPSGLATSMQMDEQAKLVKKLFLDTGRGGTETSRTLQKSSDMVKYAKKVRASLGIKAGTGPLRPIGNSKASAEGAKPASRSRPLPDALDRQKMVPRGFKLAIASVRAQEVFEELRTLSVVDYPNACAVLFRIFLEFSIQHYVENEQLRIPAKATLADKVRIATEHLLKEGRVKKAEIAMVNKGLNTPNHFLSISQLNQYVHNPYMHPAQRELNATWNGSEGLLRALWTDYAQQNERAA